MPFSVCSGLKEMWSGNGYKVDDDCIGLAWHFRQDEKAHKPICQASLFDFIQLPVQSGVFVSAVLMTSQVEHDKTELSLCKIKTEKMS